MTTSVNRSSLQVISITVGKVALALWLIQLAHGEPDAACKLVPDFGKNDTDEKCCEMPQFFLNETIDECWNGFEKSSKTQAEKSCEFSMCVFKKNNQLKSDGLLDVDRIRAFIKDTMKASSEWKSLIEQVVVNECIPLVEKDAPAIQKLMKSTSEECNSVHSFVIACSVAKFYAKCPASNWSGGQMCNDWRAYFTKCSNTVEDLNEMFKQIESHKMAEGQ